MPLETVGDCMDIINEKPEFYLKEFVQRGEKLACCKF